MFQITHDTTTAMTRSKFPDFSLTFPNIFNFPWPITKFPDNSLTFCLVWNFPDFSLTAGHRGLILKFDGMPWKKGLSIPTIKQPK